MKDGMKLGLGVLLLIGLGWWFFTREQTMLLETQHTSAGWGYRILRKSQIMIDQPTIPGVAGLKGFSTEQQAQRTGELVLLKIRAGHFPPSLSRFELDSMGVLR